MYLSKEMVPNEMLKKDEGVFSISLWLGIKCVNKTATSNPNPFLYTYLKKWSQMKCSNIYDEVTRECYFI